MSDYDAARKALVDTYEPLWAAQRQVEDMAALVVALAAREAHPDAYAVVLEPHDQGSGMVATALILPDGTEHYYRHEGDEVWLTFEGMAGEGTYDIDNGGHDGEPGNRWLYNVRETYQSVSILEVAPVLDGLLATVVESDAP